MRLELPHAAQQRWAACSGGVARCQRRHEAASRRRRQPVVVVAVSSAGAAAAPGSSGSGSSRTSSSSSGSSSSQGRSGDFGGFRQAGPLGGAGAAAAPPTPEEVRRRAEELRALLTEAAELSLQTGPRGLFRGLQAARAVTRLAAEYLRPGARLDPPQVLLRKLFEGLGATYVKLGQFIASSPSLFPEEYVLEFQKCLDRTDPVPFEEIRATITADLGRPLPSVFSYIDPQPLASASVAQVHAAVLAGSGQDVVVKVLRPGTEDVLVTDLNFLYLASRLLEFAQPELKRLSLGGVLADIRASMMDEVDFTKEAHNLATFAAFLDRRGLRGVATCPAVYRQFSSRRVLVMERLTGVPLTDLDAVRSITSRDPEAVMINALNTWFASVLGAETFHADVHAGNLLVLPDGRVAFLDFGIVGTISPAVWAGMEALLSSVALGDYNTMARALATIGACADDVDYGAFARDLAALFTELESLNSSLVVTATAPGGGGGGFGSTSSSSSSSTTTAAGIAASLDVDQEQVNRLLLDLVAVGERHGVRFPRSFGIFVKQVLYFDRYVRLLAPELQVFNDARVAWKAPPGGGGGASGSAEEDSTVVIVDV